MKKGKEYEDFVYKIFSEFFKGFTLKQNERIRGKESEILREIDITIKGKVEDTDLLYLVQAKDYYNHPADINVIGTFSAVIKDLGASKGFLICASGFTRTTHQYARALGIELLSVEDIQSVKWKATVEIPIIYVCYDIFYKISIAFSVPILQKLLKINKKTVEITVDDRKSFSIDGGKTFLHIDDYIQNLINKGELNFSTKKEIKFNSPVRLLKFPTLEITPSNVELMVEPQKKSYLKYLVPDEYRGIRDHLSKTFMPTTFKISNIPLNLDDSFIHIEDSEIPINPTGFSIKIEVKPDS